MYFARVVILIAALLVILTSSSIAVADPLSFGNVVALQNGGATRIDLLSNPTLIGPKIDFLVDIFGATGNSGSTLLVSFTQAGFTPLVQTFNVPFADGLPPDYTQIFSFTAQNTSFQGTPATLTVNLRDGSLVTLASQTYRFRVADPIPEPTSSSLLILGALGLMSVSRSRRC